MDKFTKNVKGIIPDEETMKKAPIKKVENNYQIFTKQGSLEKEDVSAEELGERRRKQREESE